jgi:uncharacterized protein (DUF1330 family)
MPAYLIAICRNVTDRKRLEDYWANVGPTFEGFGIKPLASYTPFEVLEPGGPVEGVVLIEFPSMETAKRWYTSAAYQEVKKQRQAGAEFEFILVDGGRTPPAARMPHSTTKEMV